MAKSFLASGAMLVVAAPHGSSALRDLDGKDGVLGVIRSPRLTSKELTDLLNQAGDIAVALVLDDAELYRDCEAAEILRRLVEGTAGPHRAVVLGGSANELCTGFSGWQVEAKRARQGVLLSPQTLADGDLIGVRLPRSSLGNQEQPGRALLHLGNGQLLTVQVPA